MGRGTRFARRAAAMVMAGAVIAGVGLLPSAPAGAAGVTTHAWMAREAIDKVTSPQLKALLNANKQYVRAGAHFPDSGYALSNTYGEEAHWQRFANALTAQIQTHTECTDFTAIHGPCAPLVAFLMGITAHGMGDEVWDWLFEPNVPDLDEYYVPEDLGSYVSEGGAETQMDLVAVADFGEPTSLTVSFPNHTDLLAALTAAGTNVPDSQLSLGQVAMDVVHKAETAWAPTHIDDLHKAMPWMSHNMITAPGGVHYAATAIAGYWDSMWGRLLGDQPQTKVSVSYPAADQRRIPATGWVRDHSPGSARGRGGARTRVTASLTYARPYNGSGFPVTQELPEGSMTLVERDTETPVAAASGWPRSAPYGADAGEHTIGFEPAADLNPCTWYTASVTSNLIDADGKAVAPYSWDFRTGTDADGNRCDDDPYTPDENFARKVTGDLFDRTATETELQQVGYTFARGRTRKAYAKDQLGSLEERRQLVTAWFQHVLDRDPDAGGLAYWSKKLQTISLPEFQARVIGSDEVFRKAGSTNAGYVAALYPLVHGRDVDPSGAAYWTHRLDAGLSRIGLARMLLTSHEAAQRTVVQAYEDLLGRTPDASGKHYWTGVLERGADPRDLWTSIILSAEYDRRAQDS
jgi:hypothetical protein